MRALLAAVLALFSAALLAQQPEGAVTFKVPVLPEVGKHIELFETPAYLALALENNGLSPSLSSRLEILSRESAKIRAGIMTYMGRKGSVFKYEAGLSLSFGVGDAKFTVPVEVDTSALGDGTLTVRVYPPLARLLPQALVDKIDFKIRSLANLAAQRKVVEYLDKIANAQMAKGGGRERILEAIAFDAYNRIPAAVVSGSDRGGAEALSDQIMLLLTLAIWFAGFPIFLFVVRRRRKGQRPA